MARLLRNTAGQIELFTPIAASAGAADAAKVIQTDTAGKIDTTLLPGLVTDIIAMRLASPINGTEYYLQYHTSSGDTGGGYFSGVTGAAPGTYVDDNAIVIVPTGGDGSAAFVRNITHFVTPEMFGANNMQSAINYSATHNINLFLAPIIYTCGKLYLRYDAINNTGYPHGKATSIRIIGSGRMSINDEILGNTRGTVINSTVVTGPAIEFGLATSGTSADLGQSILSDLTIRANTTGYVFDLSHFHQSTLHRVLVRQLNVGGSGVLASTIWESDILDVSVLGAYTDFSRKPSAYSSGIGFNIGDIGGDMIGMEHITARGFNIGISIATILNDGNVTLRRCNGLICNTGIVIGNNARNIVLENSHGELNSYANVLVQTGARDCFINGGLFLAGVDIHHVSFTVSYGVTIRNSGKFYLCVQAGTTGAASPPTGIGVGIIDGTVLWDYAGIATGSIFTSIEFQTGAFCDIDRAKVIVNDGASGIISTTSSTTSIQNIRRCYFQQAYAGLASAVGIANSASTVSGVSEAIDNRFDGGINTQINKLQAYAQYTDSSNLTASRIRPMALPAGPASMNISSDRIIHASGNAVTVSGITSALPAGTTVKIRFIGAGITLVHSASFALAGKINAVWSTTGAIFEFYTHNGTNWSEVSRTIPGATGKDVPAGGILNQVLAKINAIDFSTTWITTALLSITQTFTAAQRVAPVAIPYTLTINPDMSLANDFDVGVLTGNITLGLPTNLATSVGQKGSIHFQLDAIGGWTISFNTIFKFDGAAPTQVTAANTISRLDYCIKSATEIQAAHAVDVK